MAVTLDRLRLLHAVAAHGSIAAAARDVGFTASAVSQQLAALERDVSAALFERSNRGVTVTETGRILGERASVILDLVDAAVAEVGQQDPAGRASPLRIGAFPTAVGALILPMLAELPASVNVTIVDLEPGAALAALLARHLDAAIVDRYDDDWDPLPATLERTTLLVEPLRIVVRSRSAAPTRLDALADARWVLGSADSRLGRTTRAICHAAGFEPTIVAETDDHRVAFDIVRATGAVTMQPDLTLADRPSRLVTAAIDLECMRHVDFVTRSLPVTSHPGKAALVVLAETLVATAAARG